MASAIGTNAAHLSPADSFAPASRFMSLVEYDARARTLDITFHSGSKIRYLWVFPVTFSSFKESPTHDAFYARAIKGQVQSVKLIDKGIGRTRYYPLKPAQQEKPLDAGLKRDIAHTKRIAGTISRAFAGL